LKKSFEEIESSIQKLLYQKSLQEIWAKEILALNSQIIRETNSLTQILADKKPWDPDCLGLRDIRDEITEMEKGLREIIQGNKPFSQEDIRRFLNHYSRFPNLLVNFLSSNAPLGKTLPQLLPARQTLQFFLRLDEIPKGPLLGEDLTLEYFRNIQEISTEFLQLYLAKPDGMWTVESSMSLQELRYQINGVREQSLEKGLPDILQKEITLLQEDLNGLIKDLERVPWEYSFDREPEYLIKVMHQVPSSFADFLLESDFHQLISARRFAKEAQTHFKANDHP
jgi:hypothetical protein